MTMINILEQSSLAGSQVNLVSMPGIGIEYFLREYANQANAELEIVDARFYSKSRGGTNLINEIAKEISKIHPKSRNVIIAVARLDRSEFLVSAQFFSNLRSTLERSIGGRPIAIVYTSNSELKSRFSNELRNNLSLVADTKYVKPMNYESLAKYEKFAKKAYEYCGGHLHLLRSLKSGVKTNLTDQICEELVQYLSPPERKIVLAIGGGTYKNGKQTSEERLEKIGFIRKQNDKYLVFCEVFNKYLKKWSNKSSFLPPREKLLYDLLLSKKDEIVDKDTIIAITWGEEMLGEVSDWALNSLVYRLRNNDSFMKSGYQIVNRKKQGYKLY